MPAAPTATADHIKDVNTRYHDVAAGDYDAKWGIDFGPIGQDQVRSKIVKALGYWPDRPFGDSLEIGAGTGYFTLNAFQQGLMERATCTDISAGMIEAAEARAAELGIPISARVADAEALPFDDGSFDLVMGHAVLHHIPDLRRAFAEFARVLRPGGAVVFCGEPSANGDRLAVVPKRLGVSAAPLWRRLVGAQELSVDPGHACDGHELEPEVDVHAFEPGELEAMIAGAGFDPVRVRGEELLANVYGWLNRSLEATAEPSTVPDRWRRFAFRSYIAIQRLDSRWLEPNLPPRLFYNLILSARKPG
jgi:ubiquinone/menaquinone biosynthesis C-methylase UbiE